ncbi:MAG: hypothetical protein G5703_12910 [Serratia symbiotica]|nr:hypothetical protein [Serratia symbiotica]
MDTSETITNRGDQNRDILQRDKTVVLATSYLFKQSWDHQKYIRQAFGIFPQYMLAHRVFDKIAEMANATLITTQGALAKAITIPHLE